MPTVSIPASEYLKLGILIWGWILVTLILFFLIRRLVQKVPKRRLSFQSDERGGYTLEFAMVAVVFLMINFAYVQFCLVLVGQLVVEYSAYQTARAACVFLSDTDLGKEDLNQSQSRSQRMEKIRTAAALACVPISPPASRALANYPGLAGAVGSAGGPVDVGVLGSLEETFGATAKSKADRYREKFQYALGMTRVTLKKMDGAEGGDYGEWEPIVTEVEHDFYLIFPGMIVHTTVGGGMPAITLKGRAVITNEGGKIAEI